MSVRGETPQQLDDAIDALLGQPGWLRPLDEGPLSATARVLRDALPRFHPRSGFEERLARSLSAAGTLDAGRSAGRGSMATVVPFRRPAERAGASERSQEQSLQPSGGSAERWRRGLVAGGAIASGVSLAIPIAGAAVVAWRRLRAPEGLR
jgi:hypothetical protein